MDFVLLILVFPCPLSFLIFLASSPMKQVAKLLQQAICKQVWQLDGNLTTAISYNMHLDTVMQSGWRYRSGFSANLVSSLLSWPT